MITLPDEGVFLKDAKGRNLKLIVLYSTWDKFHDQIKGLFNLVSMSIRNCRKKILIMNQYLNITTLHLQKTVAMN